MFEKINDDNRGKIFKLTLDKVYWLSFTKRGFSRGGDIHDGRQFNVVLKGEFKVLMHYEKREVEVNMFEGDSIVIPENVPHVFIAKQDSWMLEWHDHKLPPYKDKRFYRPYRDRVDKRK